MSVEQTEQTPQPRNSAQALRAWTRALERTAKIAREPHTTFPVVIARLADQFESTPALKDPEVTLSYRELAERANRFARWSRDAHLSPGDTVCLLMHNCADYLAIWLGLTRAGLTVALINTHLTGDSLAHSIRIVTPRAIITGRDLAEQIVAIQNSIGRDIACWTHRDEVSSLPRIDDALHEHDGHPLDPAEFPLPSLSDRALYIYTSGTTGLPKAAIVSHLRVMQWTHWFCGMMAITPSDRMYNCLPLYHSVGGVVAACAPLVGGSTVVLRERFSASGFWQDVIEERCTLFQYIGELCRYLVNSPSQNCETAHEIRLACGNGLREDVWIPFQNRFRIPQILEYYASTEGTFSLYNCEGRPGSIGRIPPMLAHRYPVAIIRIDPDTGQPIRDASGLCIRCTAQETGEAIGQISATDQHDRSGFEGYADTTANATKIIHDVFRIGDTWYRTGDLMRRDEKSYFYFVDRIGDTFRWKGENVSTTEVAAILRTCRGIVDAAVYGVAVPGSDGRAGMAALVIDSAFELNEFRRETSNRLPAYARPVFLRIVSTLSRTETFKLQILHLQRLGYNPNENSDALYVYSPSETQYVEMDNLIHTQISSGCRQL